MHKKLFSALAKSGTTPEAPPPKVSRKTRKLFQHATKEEQPPSRPDHLAEMSHHSRMKEHHERAAYHRNEAAHHERMFQMHRQMHEATSVPQNPPGPAHPPGVTAEPSAKG